MTLNLTDAVVAFDFETLPFSREDPAPPPVCLSLAGGLDSMGLLTKLLSQHPSLVRQVPASEPMRAAGAAPAWMLVAVGEAMWSGLSLASGARKLVAHNAPYDWLVWERHAPWSPLITDMVERGILRDTALRESLICIAMDWFVYDPRINFKRGEHRNDGATARVALWQAVLARFGVDLRAAKKGPDVWRTRYEELLDVPLDEWPEAALQYAAEDAGWCLATYEHQAQPVWLDEGVLVHDDGTVQDEDLQHRAAWALRRMGAEGLMVDPARAPGFIQEVRRQLAQREQAALDLGFLRINKCKGCEGTGKVGEVPDLRTCQLCGGAVNPKAERSKVRARQQAWVSFAYGGDPPMTKPSKTFPRGQIKTSTEVIEDANHPTLAAFAEGSRAEKLMSTYVPILQTGMAGVPVTCSYNPLVGTGRTSCADPNWQNPPTFGGFRECWVARPGTVWCSCDYNQQELVELAQTTIDLLGHRSDFVGQMAADINAGIDLHKRVGCNLMSIAQGRSIALDEYLEMFDNLDHPDHALAVKFRQRAKPANFGFPGGMGIPTFIAYAKGYGVALTEDEAAQARDAWFAAFPEMRDYLDLIGWAVRRGGGSFRLVQLPSGRMRGGCGYSVAANSLFQGRGADASKEALWRVTRACYDDPRSPLYGVRPLVFVHDEIIAEGPKDTAHLWAPELRRLMVEAMQPTCPDVRAVAEEALMPRWFKKASPAWIPSSEGRRLVPWVPGMLDAPKEYSYEEYMAHYLRYLAEYGR